MYTIVKNKLKTNSITKTEARLAVRPPGYMSMIFSPRKL